MELIGSLASPYVRRVRLQLGGRDYFFKKVNVFGPEGQEIMIKYSPTKRVPVLRDGETVVWDSLLIAEYLLGSNLEFELKKKLILINEMSDAGIQLFQLRKFKVDINDSSQFSLNNLERIKLCLEYFDHHPPTSWDLEGQWLYCTLDWFNFRDVYKWQFTFPSLNSWFLKQKDQAFVAETDPRLG